MGCIYFRMLVALALVDSVKPSCLVEDQYEYFNFDNLNWGPSNPQTDWESCRSSCESNHQTATHFVYIKSHQGMFGIWTGEDCWCKTSKSGRKSNSNAISGEVCRGKIKARIKVTLTLLLGISETQQQKHHL